MSSSKEARPRSASASRVRSDKSYAQAHATAAAATGRARTPPPAAALPAPPSPGRRSRRRRSKAHHKGSPRGAAAAAAPHDGAAELAAHHADASVARAMHTAIEALHRQPTSARGHQRRSSRAHGCSVLDTAADQLLVTVPTVESGSKAAAEPRPHQLDTSPSARPRCQGTLLLQVSDSHAAAVAREQEAPALAQPATGACRALEGGAFACSLHRLGIHSLSPAGMPRRRPAPQRGCPLPRRGLHGRPPGLGGRRRRDGNIPASPT